MNPQLVLWWVCKECGQTYERLTSRERTSRLVWLRWVCFDMLKSHFGLSSAEIARLFKRDHATVLWGFKRIRQVARIRRSYLKEWCILDRRFARMLTTPGATDKFLQKTVDSKTAQVLETKPSLKSVAETAGLTNDENC